MCMFVDPAETAKYEHTKGVVKCWKVLRLEVSGGKKFIRSSYFDFQYTAGWNVSDRIGNNFWNYNKGGIVTNGIHVFRNENRARNESACTEHFDRCHAAVVPVYCRYKDLVAAGHDLYGRNTFVFRKVYLRNKDFLEAIGEPVNALT